MRKNKKGFTLIEIIVVVVVLAVLMAVAVPSVLKYIHEADDAKVYTVVRTYMNDIEIAKAKAMIDDQDETDLKWYQFEEHIANYLVQEKLYTNRFGSVDQAGTEHGIDRRVEGYYIVSIGYVAKNNNGDTIISYEDNGNLSSGFNDSDSINFSNGVNIAEYKFKIMDSTYTTQYIISCIPNGKITILSKGNPWG